MLKNHWYFNALFTYSQWKPDDILIDGGPVIWYDVRAF